MKKTLFPGALPDEILAALRDSLPAELPRASLERMSAGATLECASAGEHLYREGDGPFVILLLAGLVRVYMTSSDGRQVTARYLRHGELAGVGSLFTGGPPLNFMALNDVRALRLRPEALDAVARTDAQVGYALAALISRRLVEFQREIAVHAFLGIRQRIAKHLLDVARPLPRLGLVSEVSQQQLADAVGSVREVVARTLRELRTAGTIASGLKRIRIVDAERLHRLTTERE